MKLIEKSCKFYMTRKINYSAFQKCLLVVDRWKIGFLVLKELNSDIFKIALANILYILLRDWGVHYLYAC